MLRKLEVIFSYVEIIPMGPGKWTITGPGCMGKCAGHADTCRYVHEELCSYLSKIIGFSTWCGQKVDEKLRKIKKF